MVEISEELRFGTEQPAARRDVVAQWYENSFELGLTTEISACLVRVDDPAVIFNDQAQPGVLPELDCRPPSHSRSPLRGGWRSGKAPLVAEQPEIPQGGELHVAPECGHVGAQLDFGGEVLQDKVLRAVFQTPALISIPLGVTVGNGCAACLDEEVVQEEDLCTRSQAPIDGGQKSPAVARRDMRPPESGEDSVEAAEVVG